MKIKKLLIVCMAFSVAVVLLNGCNKSENSVSPKASSTTTTVALHGMGLNPGEP